MNFDFSDEQQMLQDSIHRLLSDRYTFDQRHKYLQEAGGWSRRVWKQYAELGLLALPFSSEDGGLNGTPVDTMIVMHAMGRHLTLEPYLATVVLGGGFLRHAGTVSQRETLVPQIMNGDLILAFAHVEKQARYDLACVETTAKATSEGYVLSGNKRAVLHGGSADFFIVSARLYDEEQHQDGITLFLVKADAQGVSRRTYTSQDRLNMADVSLNDTHVSVSAVLGSPGEALPIIERVVDETLTALCSEAIGAMERVHELTVDYLKMRKQFGVPIGSFQVLQHRAVDMLVMLEQARSMAMYAAMQCSEDDAGVRSRAIAAAKIQIARSGRWVGQQGIQLHGGIGATEECHVGHYMRRLSMIEILFGDADHHLMCLAEQGGPLRNA